MITRPGGSGWPLGCMVEVVGHREHSLRVEAKISSPLFMPSLKLCCVTMDPRSQGDHFVNSVFIL